MKARRPDTLVALVSIGAALVPATLGVGLIALDRARHADPLHTAIILVADEQQATPQPGIDVRYGREVRPILADRCFLCHGPDASTRAVGLRLDLRESAVALPTGPDGEARSASPAIVPGDPDASELWRRVNAHNPLDIMPPSDSGKRPLSDHERAVIRAWIVAGAPYEDHWSFTVPRRPAVPGVRAPGWVRNPIDQFILAGLEARGLGASPEADRATLLRRVFLDLTGLPPTPEELDEFLADDRAGAYERWVDRLLSDEPYVSRYAERMASPWLDQARYADTSGIHMDAGRSIWLWRDWVLGAYRTNMPFDRFIIEQLAGDLLAGATTDQIIATGFNRNHVTTDEGGAIDAEYLLEYAVDRVSTTGSVLLGLSLGCARCHDHKYDPISMEDFYSFLAFFNSIEEPGLYSQVPDARRALEPFIPVPTEAQARELARLDRALAALQQELTTISTEEADARDAFLSDTGAALGVEWERTVVEAASSLGGATMTVLDDTSVLASGTLPERDTHTLTLTFSGSGRNMLLLEALPDPSLGMGRVGRNFNGNAVLTSITVRAESLDDPQAPARDVELIWAWASHEQGDGDFAVVNAIDPDHDDDQNGWAVDAHRTAGPRVAMFLAGEPFAFEGGTRLTVSLEYNSIYANHAFGRVRLSVGTAPQPALHALPVARGSWHIAGPFGVRERAQAFRHAFGPEGDTRLDPALEFADPYGRPAGAEPGVRRWTYAPSIRDGVPVSLDPTLGATYVARRLYAPTARTIAMSFGSDDGLRVALAGSEILAREVDRGVAPDQDRIDAAPLPRGLSVLTLKVSNTGGVAAVYWRQLDTPSETSPELPRPMEGVLAGAILPEFARTDDLEARIGAAWLEAFSPRRRELAAEVARVERDLAALRAQVPVTMVMKELPHPRPTFVHTRGQYDASDPDRPVARGVPRALGTLEPPRPSEASLEPPRPLNRLDLAKWLMSDDNPLVARVTVNRLWAQVFGQGIVRTTEDLGLQGDWPSHPELLDYLAVRFREDGWDVRALLRLIVTSATYRQSSRLVPEAVAIDPDNRLLAFFPRQRLSAEQIRDQALYVSGLLVERLGGPSVKPYQPAGLWEEVAMPQSNTRVYERGTGEDLWRRSLYTYWKRASPPPAMLAFDAPTRESCVVSRTSTSTPLQALALWNDEQLVEAARALAARTLLEDHLDPTIDDTVRLARLYRRITGNTPDPHTLTALSAALTDFRTRYTDSPADAARLLEVGDSMPPANFDPSELAAWTMIASAILSSDAAIMRD